jgi:hypothetical protein
MFSFLKGNKNKNEVPEWASFFGKKEYEEFLANIGKYFKTKNFEFIIDDGVLNGTESFFGLKNLGLINVAQVCKQSTPHMFAQYKKVL